MAGIARAAMAAPLRKRRWLDSTDPTMSRRIAAGLPGASTARGLDSHAIWPEISSMIADCTRTNMP